jgi:phage shock protein PspC (stress-responsive transcriptional regulator)
MRKSQKTQIGGVCGGLGEHSPIPSWIWRALFLVIFLLFGSGALVYGVLWLTMPEARDSARF